MISLADAVLSHGGAVYGACMEEDCELTHICITRREDLYKIQKSKYFQSNTSDSFRKVREQLKARMTVLFSGTACQIAGLQGYLRGTGCEMERLYCVEVLCHGASNKEVFRRYLRSQERRFGKNVTEATFRTKEIPWQDGGGTSMTLSFEDGDFARYFPRKIVDDARGRLTRQICRRGGEGPHFLDEGLDNLAGRNA